jgi:hypothetical protein
MDVSTLNMTFSVTCYLELRDTISNYCASHILLNYIGSWTYRTSTTFLAKKIFQ